MAEFCSARSNIISPLQWTSLSPPFTEFIEIFVDTPLEICEQRDIKGLYKKARAGDLKNFTGIDSPYEEPETAEIHVNTVDNTADEAAEFIIEKLMC